MDVFNTIYHNNIWKGAESVSGKGSGLAATVNVRKVLLDVLDKYNIKSVFDAGCGDFWWMKEIITGNVHYTGMDVVEEMVVKLKRWYPNDFFLVGDITSANIIKHDLVLCRDVLVHLSNDSIAKALSNFKRSGSTYLLTTMFPKQQTNKDITTGSWRPLNLMKHPFNLPKPLERFQEYLDYEQLKSSGVREIDYMLYMDKSLYLWKLEEVSC